jgi:hypothetical protein
VQKWLEGWKERFLSHVGKEILIKAVVQAIPMYTMGVFKLPKTLCKSLNSTISRFWWGCNNNSHQCSWLSWDKMGASKAQGGIGFKDLETFNSTLLAKQGW